jgi:arylsulfatase A-like enzyme
LKQDTLLFYCGDNGTSPEASVATPHRGVKSTVYEGGILVPGLMEWPARIPQPRTSGVRTSTSDLLPTLCALTGQPLPDRPLDGIDLSPVFDGTLTERPVPQFFWMYETARFDGLPLKPYIDPVQQEGTTPLVKLMGGKATRDFTNYHQPPLADADFLGPRAIIDGSYKLVIHNPARGGVHEELFDLSTDPAEKTNLLPKMPERATKLHGRLREWQQSVLQSLSGADYSK